MKLTLNDLQEYACMDTHQRMQPRGREIRDELNLRMKWMPKKWRRLIHYRYLLGYHPKRVADEMHVGMRTVYYWTRELGRWLKDKDEYLDEIT